MIVTLTWLPMLVLSLRDGFAVAGVKVPFFYDLEVQARFLIAVPLLIVAAPLADRVLSPALRQFLDARIASDADTAKFKAIAASTARWSESLTVEVGLFASVFFLGSHAWAGGFDTRTSTWYAAATQSGLRPTLPGYWYVWVALPISQFILLRWYFRQLLWGSFLWRVSRLDLRLVPTHPDRAGGLGFLGSRIYAFVPFLLGLGVILTGILGNRILNEDAGLRAFAPEIAGAIGFALILVLGPPTMFFRCLRAAKRNGTGQYGSLARRYAQDKWLRETAAQPASLAGSGELRTLTDIANSYAIVARMRTVPFGKETVALVVLTTILPMLPLVLTIIPAEKMLL